ncbi:E3 ubiquitin-protein ligase TRIM33-like [Patella vulgata]|uniref:E3 ubiquitin-protein ligase TRIM33-like n=1 Tax=Patella vulgata TaxID=6465 RepID=UPI0024A9013F|nr:E3 ubiquitin-protein ligase TRIM33-like [Patella vulgata]
MAEKEVCSICLNEFQQRVVLDCAHPFCFICLEDYVNKTSTKDQFQCPLCRIFINLSDGGLDRFKPKPINIPQCDVCTEDTSQYFCRDCDQYLCKSCKTMHDKLKSCKDHVVSRYDETQIYQAPTSHETIKEKASASSIPNPKDFCLRHEKEPVKVYCKDCTVAVCLKCFLADHNGHNYLDLQEDEVRQSIRHDLQSLNDELKKQITNFQKHYDNLNSKLTEVKNCTKTECDKVDAQVEKICSEFHKIGENIKKEMQETSEEEEYKFRKLMEDIKRLTEDLKASVKYSVNVLEDSSVVQVLQRIPKVRQEKDESCCRKLDIPDVRYSTFQVAEIDRTLLTNQLGKIVSCHQNMIGKVVSCHQNMFEDVFNVDTVPGYGGWYYGKQHVVSGFTWRIDVYKLGSSLFSFGLNLNDVEDKSITSCKVDVTCKLINKTDDRQSVVKQCNGTVRPGVWSDCSTDLTDLERRLSNPGSGFIDDHRNFTIQVTINKITDIKID